MSADLLLGTSDGSPVPSMPSARTFEQNLNPAFAFARIVSPKLLVGREWRARQPRFLNGRANCHALASRDPVG